ncbi:uncharacterized protein LOC107360278 [Tetranychus urticae]|uniref:Uncharacterized protein n=1 Tax=Tetranychus urticae TaxID=32264 RepID=T1K5J4_TETUR|nr:uncharacterized protein LOC107360278 [Tetranychus urticae]
MDTVGRLKRPITEASDPLKMLICKNCRQDEVVLNLRTCGCILCESCHDDSPDKCISCRSNVDPKMKLSFSKNLKCKFYDIHKCFNSAEYRCKCIQSFLCGLCLHSTHKKKVRGSCDPEILRPNVTSANETCEMCNEFIAEFKMVSEPFTKICFNCRVNKNIACVPYEKKCNTDSEWNQFYKDFGESSQMTSDKIKKVKKVLEASGLVREQEIKKCKDAISAMQKCLDEFTEKYDRHILTVKQKLDSFNKILNILKPDGKFKTIVDQLKNEKLILHGEEGKDQIDNFLEYYRQKNNYNPSAEQIKTFVIQNNSSRTHILKFPLPSSPNAGVPGKSNVSVQEIIDNGVKPFFIAVEVQNSVSKRKKILQDIERHKDKWVRKKKIAAYDIVIIFDADAKGPHKYKRAKILKKEASTSKVSLLDFGGFEVTVENSSIGEIQEISIDGHKTSFLATLTEIVDVKCGIERESWISNIPADNSRKATHIHLID